MRSSEKRRRWFILLLVLAVSDLLITVGSSRATSGPATVKYVIDTPRSKFMARAFAGGLLWFKGHDHHLVGRDFSGEVELTPDAITPASLRFVVKAESLVETGEAFTAPQKEIINKELREIVFHPDRYPDISFQSASVSAEPSSGGGYNVKIRGNLTLHGVTKPVTIPAHVTLQGNDLRAIGEFSVDRGDFGVKATSAFHGMVRVRDSVKIMFDIVAHR